MTEAIAGELARTLHPVHFQGARSGRSQATWGQSYWRRQMEVVGADDYSFNGIVPGGTDVGFPVDAALQLVRALLLKHDSLRTTHSIGSNGYEQVLHGEGTLTVIVENATDLADSEERAARLCTELYRRRVDIENELPLRVAFVTVDGLVRQLALMVSHLSVDGTGTRLLANELLAMGPGLTAAEVQQPNREAQQPLDEAAYQSSEAGRRHDARVRRRVLDEIRNAPAPLYPKPRDDAEPRFLYRKAILHSSQLLRAAELLAHREQVTPSTLILAAAAMAFARATERDECLLRLLVSNRFMPGLTEAISPIAMDTPFHIGGVGRGAEFSEVLPRVWKRSMRAFRNAYYDSGLLYDELERHPELDFDDSCRYNDHLPLGPGAWEYQFKVPDGEIGWREYPVREADDRALCLDVHDAGTGIELALLVDLRRVDAATAEKLLRDIEDILVIEAARNPEDSTHVQVAAHPSDADQAEGDPTENEGN